MPGRLPDAIAEYQAAVRLAPDWEIPRNNLGYALARTPGGLPHAIAEYQAALRIKPDYAEAHYNLGLAWSRIPAGFRCHGRVCNHGAASARFCRRAQQPGEFSRGDSGPLTGCHCRVPGGVAARPDFAPAHYNLGVALSKMAAGRLRPSRNSSRAEIQPDYAEAHNSLECPGQRFPAGCRRRLLSFGRRYAYIRTRLKPTTTWESLCRRPLAACRKPLLSLRRHCASGPIRNFSASWTGCERGGINPRLRL